MGSKKPRFRGGLHYYHRNGDGQGDSGPTALSWEERTKQMARSRRNRIWFVGGSSVLVLGVVVATFLLMMP